MLNFLSELREEYPTIEIKEYEIYFNNENRQLFESMADAFGTKIEGVPTAFINDKVIVGFSNSLAESIETDLQSVLQENLLSQNEYLRSGKTIICVFVY